MRNHLIILVMLLCSAVGYAQPGGNGGKKGGKGGGPSTGKIYGKVIEEENKKPIEYAVLQVFRAKTNPADSSYGELISGGLTETNGDFNVDNVPVNEKFVLVVSFVGFGMKEVNFTLQPSGPGLVEKDLGNIKLSIAATLGEVTIDGSDSDMRIEFDKRIYDVEKNPINAGGTGEDVLRNIPSLQVDMDGNVTMRNSPPQIFVDGRPTTLTIDQIPADAIQRVEVITNPSAKYDASGGAGGIVNIVMKHNRSMGYNGSLRLGMDSRPRYNGGADLNLREGKFNFFLNGNYNQRKSISTGSTDRTSYTTTPFTQLDQSQTSVNLGYFLNGKIGVDYFADNRNTLTISQSLTRGKFNPTDEIEARTDSLIPNSELLPYSMYWRESVTNREFQNWGSSVLFKHLFAKEGTEITADVNMNRIESDFMGDYVNRYSNAFSNTQRQSGGGKMQLYTAQTDFTSKVNENLKLEFGLRGAIRHYESIYDNFRLVDSTNQFVSIPGLLVNYEYWDQVYAAYGNVSKNMEKWKLQAGLRLESSDYQGELRDTTVKFRIQYPLSLFPSLFITRVINEKQDVQIAFSRKINRPSFMQLIPFVDYSDSLNVSRGNPLLRPEFTNLAELSYQNSYSKKNVFIATAYARYITDLTIRNQITEFNEVMNQDIVVNTYDNAKSSAAFGLELVSRSNITEWFSLTLNLNLYNSSINGTNISENFSNSLSSWWTKTNAIVKLPSSFTFQALFDYSSKKALTVGSSERGGGMGGGGFGGGGGPGGFGGTDNTVQGYVRPTYSLDLSIKKEFLKNKNMSLTVSMQDVLRTRVQYTHSETSLFIQDTFRRRDWQVVRIQFGWKFGKVDSSVFKRKNMKQDGGGMEG